MLRENNCFVPTFSGLVLLLVAFFPAPAEAEQDDLSLTMTFDFSQEIPTPADTLSVLIGFAEGSFGISVQSTVSNSVRTVASDVFVDILITPPPGPGGVVLPAMVLLNPLVELGTFEPGDYEIWGRVIYEGAEEPLFSGRDTFRVFPVPEPSSLLLACLAVACLPICRGCRRIRGALTLPAGS